MPAPTRPPSLPHRRPSIPDFPIVETYTSILSTDPQITMPIAAIESLVRALSSHPTTTVSETLQHLSRLSATLIAHFPNAISLSAGTDLFQRYITARLQTREAESSSTSTSTSTSSPFPHPPADFDTLKRQLVGNARVFVERAKASRDEIASFGAMLVREGATVFTAGGSRVVGALLREAAEGPAQLRFRVVYVLGEEVAGAGSRVPRRPRGRAGGGKKGDEGAAAADSAAGAGARAGAVQTPGVGRAEGAEGAEGAEIVTSLREAGIPVATISAAEVGVALEKVDMVLVGAEGVVESGGVISRMGTCQIAVLARDKGKPVYVLAESHKFVRLFPLGQSDLPIEQKVLDFRVEDDEREEEGEVGSMVAAAPKVDFTPPHLISGIITESGILSPSAVSEELIKIWF